MHPWFPGLMQDRSGTIALQFICPAIVMQTMEMLAYDGPAFHLHILIKRTAPLRLRPCHSPSPIKSPTPRSTVHSPTASMDVTANQSGRKTLLSPRLAYPTRILSYCCRARECPPYPPLALHPLRHSAIASPELSRSQRIASERAPFIGTHSLALVVRLYLSSIASRCFARTSYQMS
jgi:hypothetical protein